jgi:hypothetical protein
MSETIEVRYKLIFFEGLPFYHKYLIYTDRYGDEFYVRGGPQNNVPGAWGYIHIDEGPYDARCEDWNPDHLKNPDPSETILEGENLALEWGNIWRAMLQIHVENHPYNVENSNSNSAVDEALRRAGLNEPTLDGYGENWSPASGHDLPGGGDVPTQADDFQKDFREWLKDNYDNAPREWLFLVTALSPSLHPLINAYYIAAGIIETLCDPLALDLNGDGIATISANDGIMFDHNNAGIRYGTGWINPNDGWLALDRNGNGKIDSGRELFGDNTRKLDGNFAAHAYDALKSFDTNNDGQVSAADATGDADSSGTIDGSETYWDIDNNGEYDASVDKTFADLRVWVDANSNGNTDGGELKTLAELNIVSIGTGKTAVNVADENGNLNTFKGNYTNTSGEVVDGTRSFNLLQNTFHRDWPNSPNIPPDVAALPNMQGSGAVRNLHEAMSLGTPQSLALKATVQAFNNATTRGAQYALIDQLLMQWGSTSGFPDMVQRLEDMKTTYRNNQTAQITKYTYRFALTTGEFWDDSTDTYNQRNQKVDLIDDPLDKDYPLTREAKDNLYVNNPEVLAGQTTTQAAKIQALAKVRVLEAFNNAQFFDFSSRVVLSGTDDPNTPQDERTQSAQFTVSSNNTTRSRSGPDGMASTSNIIVMTEDDLPIPQSNYLHASYGQLLVEAA